MQYASHEGLNEDLPYVDEIENMLHDDHLMDTIARLEIESIKTNREDAFIACGNHIIKLVGAKTAGAANVYYTPDVIADICGSSDPKSIHFHGAYPSFPSPEDRDVYEYLFGKGVKIGCSAGIDGIRCVVPSHHEYNIPWTKEFYDRATKSGVTVIDDVKKVDCFSSEHVENARECIIKTMDGKPTFRNIFFDWLWGEFGSSVPYEEYREGDDVQSLQRTATKRTMCVMSETERPKVSNVIKSHLASIVLAKKFGDLGKKRRILTCFSRGE